LTILFISNNNLKLMQNEFTVISQF